MHPLNEGVTSPFLSGVLAAWAVATVALGLFFVLAYYVRRRESEYLLFGILCGAIAVATVGLSMTYGASDLEMRKLGAHLGYAGVIFAGTLNLHFVMTYARMARAHRIALVLYVVMGFYQIVNWGGWWWAEGSFGVKESIVFGFSVAHNTFTLTPVGRGFYIVASAQYGASIVLLFLVYRADRREALIALVGAILLGAAILNDIGLITGWIGSTIYLLPHVFVVYGFGVATTLLLRYRFAAVQLEQTVSNLQLRTDELRRSNAIRPYPPLSAIPIR